MKLFDKIGGWFEDQLLKLIGKKLLKRIEKMNISEKLHDWLDILKARNVYIWIVVMAILQGLLQWTTTPEFAELVSNLPAFGQQLIQPIILLISGLVGVRTYDNMSSVRREKKLAKQQS